MDLLRLAPDVVRLLKRLASDKTKPIGARIWLGVLLVLGYADEALVVAIALRFATRRAGSDATTKHWPGTPAGLVAVLRLADLPCS